MNFKKILIGAAAAGLLLANASGAFAAGGVNNASSCGAAHGAFNFQNSVYGEQVTLPNGNTVLNSSAYGQAGGSPVSNGGVGQEPGATGYNNSHTDCNQ